MRVQLLTIIYIVFVHLMIGAEPQKSFLNPCDLFGKIQVTNNKKQADAILYIEESEFSADLRIYEEENILMANLPGIWYIVSKDDLHHPDYKVYYTKFQYEADFSVYYVSNDNNAGCDKE